MAYASIPTDQLQATVNRLRGELQNKTSLLWNIELERRYLAALNELESREKAAA